MTVRRVLALLVALAAAACATAPETPAFEAGQVWTFKDAPTPEARVIIGGFDVADSVDVVHVRVTRLPVTDAMRSSIDARLESDRTLTREVFDALVEANMTRKELSESQDPILASFFGAGFASFDPVTGELRYHEPTFLGLFQARLATEGRSLISVAGATDAETSDDARMFEIVHLIIEKTALADSVVELDTKFVLTPPPRGIEFNAAVEWWRKLHSFHGQPARNLRTVWPHDLGEAVSAALAEMKSVGWN